MYQAFYNLTGKPFRLSPDPAFFFPSRGHKRALAYLRYGLNQDEGFVVITGSPGTGKTTLAKILLKEMGETNIVVAHLTTTQLEADDMLRMVAASFGLRYEGLDKTGLLKSLEAFLLARARERKKALLVIDEAQNLPPRSLEELRMLSNLQVGDRSLLQIFLLGQEQFRQMLDEVALEQLKQRIIANYHLSPLGPDESQRYIESRLQQVGWNSDPGFAEIAFEQIHEYTEGVPRRINMLCDRIMLFGCMEELHAITGEVVQLVTKELDEEVSGKVDYEEPEVSPKQSSAAAKKAERPEPEPQARPSRTEKAVPQQRRAVYEKEADDLDIDFSFGSDDMSDGELVAAVKSNADKRAEILRKKTNKPVKQDEAGKHDTSAGNTVRKPRQSSVEVETPQGPAEYSDRDLFRVIPGGKPQPSINPSSRVAAQARVDNTPSNEDVKLRRVLRLVLAFHRSPSRFPGLDNPEQPLPEGITELLELAIAEDEVLTKVSPAAVMGISPVMLRAAVRFFVRRALFIANGDHHRVLGVPPNAPLTLIEKHYDLLMRLLRQDKQRGSAESVNRVGQAYEVLSRTDRHAAKRPGSKPLETPVEDSSEELVIDFDALDAQREPASFGAKPNELFSPELGVSRKRMKYASQAAVLGFGVLVFILGLYIVQLEDPVDGVDSATAAMVDQKAVLPAEPMTKPSEPEISAGRKNLQFGDGSDASESVEENVQFSEKEMDAIRKELLERAAKVEGQDSLEKAEMKIAAETFENVLENASDKPRQQAQQKPQRPEAEAINSDQDPVKAEVQEEPVPVETQNRPKKLAFSEVASRSASSSRIMQNVSEQERVSTASTLRQSKQQLEKEKEVETQALIAPEPLTQEPLIQEPIVAQDPIQSPQSAAAEAGFAQERVQEPVQVANVAEPAPFTPVRVSPDELLLVVDGLLDGYESGDIAKLMEYFDDSARTNNRINAKGIRSDYEELFSSSSSRRMTISSLKWKIEGDSARGVGEFLAKINPINSTNSQQFKGDVTVQVQKNLDGIKITRLYFTNQTVSTVSRLPEAEAVAAKVPANPVQKQDLQQMLNTFVHAYAKGDLEKLMTLFASNAQTNDQNTLAGIRNDHEKLFSGTSLRQISIKSVKWTLKDSEATGEGWFQVKLQTSGSAKVNTVKGRIRISAKKGSSGTQITQMFHSVDQ